MFFFNHFTMGDIYSYSEHIFSFYSKVRTSA